MRTIKFRAWDGKKMYNHGILKFTGLIIEQHVEYNGDCCEDQIKEKPSQHNLMQFTGLKDKNGKEIYEGDIVKTLNSDGAVSIFWDDMWRLKGYVKIECSKSSKYYGFDKVEKGFAYTYGQGIFKNDEEDIEVIGNIYEDKELLK